MNLKDCTIGTLVVTRGGDIGFISGLAFNVSVESARYMTAKQRADVTIPRVTLPDGSVWAIHPDNLKKLS